jgi:hypothetical protein
MEHPDLLQSMDEVMRAETAVAAAEAEQETAEGQGYAKQRRRQQESIEQKMKAHNKKFQKKKQQYEPRKHSARDVRMWESKTKKRWSELSVDERVEVNAEITKMITER